MDVTLQIEEVVVGSGKIATVNGVMLDSIHGHNFADCDDGQDF